MAVYEVYCCCWGHRVADSFRSLVFVGLFTTEEEKGYECGGVVVHPESLISESLRGVRRGAL